jgi:hypothetical protein
MCGNHTDSFLSQAAIYRKALDTLGGDYAAARLALCVGGPKKEPLPQRWHEAFRRIEVHWVEGSAYTPDELAQSDLTYRVIDPSNDLSIICDADTLLVSPLPNDFLAEMQEAPALAACIAHYPPPLADVRVPQPAPISNAQELWRCVAARLGQPLPEMPYRYALAGTEDPVPFYINLGFFAGPPELLLAFHERHRQYVPAIREVLENAFYEQISVPFSAVDLPVRELPIRFNFPNDPIADALYPDDLATVCVIHYLRRQHFDRHAIFNDPEEFARFMRLDLEGSNAVFQSAVQRITGGAFPF